MAQLLPFLVWTLPTLILLFYYFLPCISLNFLFILLSITKLNKTLNFAAIFWPTYVYFRGDGHEVNGLYYLVNLNYSILVALQSLNSSFQHQCHLDHPSLQILE